MLLDRVIIKDFKSFSKEYNVLDINSRITTIIGKNGSGKSNILEALSFFTPQRTTSKTELNKLINLYSYENGEVDFVVDLVFDNNEQIEFSNNDRTIFTLGSNGVWCFSGGLNDVINLELESVRSELESFLNLTLFKVDISLSKKLVMSEVSHLNKDIFEYHKNVLIGSVGSLRDKNCFDVTKYKELIEKYFLVIEKYYKVLPNIFSFKDKINIRDLFTLDDITKLKNGTVNDNNIFLKILLGCLEIDIQEVFQTVSTSTSKSLREIKRSRINEKVKKTVYQFLSL